MLNKNNYFSKAMQLKYITSSQISDYILNECEARIKAMANKNWELKKTPALILGGYLDSAFTDNLDDYISENYDYIYTGRSKLKLYQDLDELIDILKQDDYFVKLISGRNQEIFTGIINDHDVACKVDSLLIDTLIDLKYCRDFESIFCNKRMERLDWYQYWNYDIRLAFYQKILLQNNIDVDVKIVAITKQNPPAKGIFKFNNETLKSGLEIARNIIPIVANAKLKENPKKCLTCDYCRSVLNFKDIQEVEI